MAQIESHSEKVSHRTVNFFKPSWAEVSLYLLLSLIILLVLNLGKFIQTLGGNYIGSPNQVKASFSNLFSGFNNSFSTALGGRLGQIILWAFIGAMAYIGLWLAKNVLNSFENDIISDHYLHPSSYNRAGYWGSSLAGKIFLGVLLHFYGGKGNSASSGANGR
jgi:flagellar biosynthesis protein FlhB